jgi:IclR family transcriptional regulator, acetate operon repressor
MARSQLSTIATTFEILEYLSVVQSASPSELSDEFDVPLSSIHSYLSTLEELEYLVNDNGTYSISASMLEIGERTRKEMELFVAGKSVVEDLAKMVEEQATLTTIENDQPVVVYNINKNENMTLKMHPGMVLPYHATVSGKLALAFTDVSIDEIETFEEYTEKTITDRSELEKQVEEIRSEEVSFAHEEFKPKLMAIAVPIFYENALSGTLSVVGPLKQMTQLSEQESVIKKLQTASNTIEVNLQNQ